MTTSTDKITVVHLGQVSVHVEKTKGIVSLSLHNLNEADYKTIAKKLGKEAVHDFTTRHGDFYRNLGTLANVTFWPDKED